MKIRLTELSEDKSYFPAPEKALQEPDGLLAMGGDLSAERIIHAYKQGIFPWYSSVQPILWWSPARRAVIIPEFCHISKSMKRLFRKNSFTITVNHAFSDVIFHCAQPRKSQPDTWITNEMIAAYIELHKQGFAHSIEVWQNGLLAGGLYGIGIGSLFCGESMFSKVSNSSKIAFIALNQHINNHFPNALIDCQMQTEHLQSLGVKELPREEFLALLPQCTKQPIDNLCWTQQELAIAF